VEEKKEIVERSRISISKEGLCLATQVPAQGYSSRVATMYGASLSSLTTMMTLYGTSHDHCSLGDFPMVRVVR
jgi:hypothetical protein